MEKINFYLINASIVPDIYKKVITAKSLLASGKAKSASQAAKMADISRSAYINIRMQFLNITGRQQRHCYNQCKAYGQCGCSFQPYERALQGRGKRFIRKSKRAYSFGSRCFRNRANCRDDRYKRRITKFN